MIGIIKKAVAISEEQTLDEMIEMILEESYTPQVKKLQSSRLHKNLHNTMLAFEKETLKNAIVLCHTTYALASYLGISQASAFRKLKKHGLSLTNTKTN